MTVHDRDAVALFLHLLKGKTCIGDSGNPDEPKEIDISRLEHPKDVKKFMDRVKSRQETFNARLNVFRVLTSYFHHCTT